MTDTERLDSLEIRIAYQDEIIETLNKAVTEQWTRIEALTREIARLTDRVREAENRAATSTAPEPPPPHY
ncbi:MAG: SlyX family protein [Pseudomonadota bacterium]